MKVRGWKPPVVSRTGPGHSMLCPYNTGSEVVAGACLPVVVFWLVAGAWRLVAERILSLVK